MLIVRGNLTPCVFTINEQLDRRVLVRFKLVDDLLIEGVHIEFFEHDRCHQRLYMRVVEAQVLRQVV